MNPDNIIYRVRQRQEWEAIDMGFRLVQHTWYQIMPAWLLLILPLAIALALVIPDDYIWAAGVVLWWLKPLYDRVLLFILSRNLFAESVSSAQVFSALPGLLTKTGLFSALTWRRFSLSRSYNLPVWQLEQLRGPRLKERKELIYLQGHSQAIALTISCRLLEMIIILSLLALVILFDPSGQVWEHWKGLFTGASGSDIEYILSLADYSTQLIALVIIEPFFVAAGFTLYLNRRTQLEAWDIELSFRSIGKRLTEQSNGLSTVKRTTIGQAFSVLAVCIIPLLLTLHSTGLKAAEDEEYLHPQRLSVEQTDDALAKTMMAEELSQLRQITTWRPRNKYDDDESFQFNEGVIHLLSNFLRLLLWAALIVALLMAFIYRQRIIEMLKPVARREVKAETPDILFGMDIRPESLPTDISAAAREYWQQGEYRAALSLLYRGTLMQLTRHDELAIADSHTEGDILSLARPSLSSERYVYLNAITRAWRSAAYAQRPPQTIEAETLFTDWEAFIAPPTPVQTTEGHA